MIETQIQPITDSLNNSHSNPDVHTSRNCVLVSTGRSKLHLYYAAEAAQNAGLLNTMVTSVYLKKRWVNTIQLLAKVIKKKFFRRLLLCRDNHISDDKVIAIPSTTAVSKLVTIISRRGLSGNSRFKLEQMESMYYGKRVNKSISPEVKLIHSRSGYSRAIIPYAKKLGIKILLDQSASHPKFANKILEQEYDKWNIPGKLRTYVGPVKEMEWDIERADYILTNSQFCADTIKPHVDSVDKIHTVYTGVDVNSFRPRNSKSDKFTVLFVGSVNINKGIMYLLKAFKKLNIPDANLIVIGRKSTDLPKEFESYNDLYKYVSFVPHNELPELMSKADVFVLPSLTEGSARVVGEAMACGVACIVTPNCGSVIKNGHDGFIVPIQNEDALAEKILYLYQNKEHRELIGQNARETAVNSLTWYDYQKNLINVYNHILNNNDNYVLS